MSSDDCANVLEVRFNRVPEKVPEKVWEVLLQNQVRFNRVLAAFGAEPGQVGAEPGQVLKGFRRRFRRRSGRLVAELGQVQQGCGVLGIFGAGPGQFPTGSTGFQRLALQHASERFVKIKRCGFWGCHRSLFFSEFSDVLSNFFRKNQVFFSDVFCRFSNHAIHRINKIPDGSASGSAGDWWPSLYFCCTM